MKNARLLVQEKAILKSGPPELMRIEVEKTMRGRRIGELTGLFNVPAVLDYDEEHGTVLLRRFRHLQSIRRRLTFGRDYLPVTRRIAESLAAVHDLLELPHDMSIPLPEEMECGEKSVFLHGDFSFNNVCVDLETDKIVILDWQMTRILGGKSTVGTRYFDMAWFLSNLFNRRIHHCPLGNSTSDTAMVFMQSYAQASSVDFDVCDYLSYLKRFIANMSIRRRRQWPISRKIMRAANEYLWQQFLIRLESSLVS